MFPLLSPCHTVVVVVSSGNQNAMGSGSQSQHSAPALAVLTGCVCVIRAQTCCVNSPLSVLILCPMCVCSSPGDHQHGPVCDALHVPALWRPRLHHHHALRRVPGHGADQAEEDCDGSCASWSVLYLPAALS